MINEKLNVNQFKKKVRISLLNLKINKHKKHIKLREREIGKKMRISRSKVQRIKQKMKKTIYNAMIGGAQNDRKS